MKGKVQRIDALCMNSSFVLSYNEYFNLRYS